MLSSRYLPVVLAACVTSAAQAHNPDTSYARFKISRDSFEAKFTLDVTTLRRIVPELDADGDHRLTPGELAAKSPAIAEFLRRYVALELNDAPSDFGDAQPVVWPPDVGEAIAEKDWHAATSLLHFVFRRRLDRVPESFWVEFRFFDRVGERHTVLGAIEQDGREQEVLFRLFEPDYYYATGYEPQPTPGGIAAESDAAAPTSSRHDQNSGRRSTDDSPWTRVKQFFHLGVEHIFLGYDHILFLLSLIVVSRFKELVKIVTSFTVAHTITLILATLEVVEIPSQWVETAIAATIVYTAVENFWIHDTAGRWKLTFAFGLVHGFGFAGVLRELGLPTTGLVRCLLSFNVGVEAGQLAIVAVLLLPTAALSRWRYGRSAQRTISAVIALCGLAWFVDRAFGLDLMPF